jgi:hypothetical protein
MSTEGGGGPAEGGLQFDKAEFSGPPPSKACALCHQAIADGYFEASGHVLCRGCGESFNRGGRVLPALLYGAGAAMVGTIVWFAVYKLFDMELGIVAIGVGLLVGIAVRKGSGGRGGRKFQALAMVLTYLSITASYVPLVLKGMFEGVKQSEARRQSEAAGGSAGAGKEPGALGAGRGARDGKPGSSVMAWLVFAAVVFGLAFASPFLAGAQNIIGIIIIGIALYEAWKLNRGVRVSGPFRLAAPAPPAASAG